MTKPATKQLNLLGMVEITADEYGQAIVSDILKQTVSALHLAVVAAGGTFTAAFDGEGLTRVYRKRGSAEPAAE